MINKEDVEWKAEPEDRTVEFMQARLDEIKFEFLDFAYAVSSMRGRQKHEAVCYIASLIDDLYSDLYDLEHKH